MATRINRRQLVSWMAALSSLTAIGAACGAPPTPTPPPPRPTEAPKPAAPPTAAPKAEAKPTEPPKPAAPPTAAPKVEAKPTVAAPAKPAAGEVTIQLNLRWPPWLQEDMLAWCKQYTDKTPGVKTNVTFIAPADWDQKAQVMFASGTIGDLIWTNQAAQMHYYSRQGVYLPLDSYISAEKYDLSDFFKKAVEDGRYEGKLYGLPFMSHPGMAGLFYHKEAFKEAGLKPPTADWTYDDFVQSAIKLTKKKSDGSFERWGAGPYLANAPGLHTPILSFGGDVISKDLKTATPDDPNTVAAVQFSVDLVHKHKVAPSPGTMAVQLAQAYGSGLVAMDLWGPWFIGGFAPNIKYEWDIAAVPKGPTGLRVTGYAANDNYTIPKAAKVPDATWGLLKHLADKDRQIDIARKRVNPPGRISAAEVYGQMPGTGPYIEQLKNGNYRYPSSPANQRMTEFWSSFQQACGKLWADSGDVKATLARVKAQMQAVIDKP